ncbi:MULTISPECIES: hypothetical protein [Vibrio]|jgi:hypothetical protein|uniref:hypothetical protein n=1 Tax=Vibrio TaxID=662 RepID=UPI000D6481EE|nr:MULTISPECIES: hypothetical protein [Vibrio]MCR9309509.1 hypothetical protein [Vibrio diabolicus]MDU9595829.1 hypothetical protein [Vibrio sp. 2-1-2a]MDU9605027.1 hypothetical protein [Vibrio sp. 1-2-3a]PWF68194.1 hypothetical protein CBX98_23045 [Vibrio sp. T9]
MFRLRHGHFLRQRENIDINKDDNEYQLHYQAYKLLKTNKVKMISKLLEEVEQREEKRQNSPEELGC